MFAGECTACKLKDANFSSLPPLTHVAAKMEHRSGPESQFWHHGVYCGHGHHVITRAVELGIDLTKYGVPVGDAAMPLGAFLEDNFDTPLICEYDGPRANGQAGSSSSTASTPTFKGRVTMNACDSWQTLYRTIYYHKYKRAHLTEEQILRNLFESLGRENYSVVFSNCEHHTTGVIKGVEESKQVQLGVGLSALVLGGTLAVLGAAACAAWGGANRKVALQGADVGEREEGSDKDEL